MSHTPTVGLVFALMYTMLSLALCIIIVGLPYARTLLRQAALCMQPYGTEMGYASVNQPCAASLRARVLICVCSQTHVPRARSSG